MRRKRDFVPGQLYGVTQRGNQGQWVYRDDQDFSQALELMRKYAARHGVLIHGWCLMHNHGHWIFEASTPASISSLMRDMQGRYSRYLNRRYKDEPWLLIGPLPGALILARRRNHYSPFHRAGPVNWTPRFDAQSLTGAGFKDFLRYLENNPVKAKLVKDPTKWHWSSARSHAVDADLDEVLSLERWRTLFGNPATITTSWRDFLKSRREETEKNAERVRCLATGSTHNRPLHWQSPDVPLTATSSPPS